MSTNPRCLNQQPQCGPDNRQPRFYSVVNPILRFLVLRFGLGSRANQDILRILRVRGRRSGRLHDVPVRVAVMGERRYILSMLGESQWVRNLRASGSAQLIVGEKVEPIGADEIQGAEKAAFLLWYIQHPQYAQRARYGLKADTRHVTPAEIARLAGLYPVFRLEQAQPPE
jgi:deazaflavin-dependent oxidoreductase (nitroreductase family)